MNSTNVSFRLELYRNLALWTCITIFYTLAPAALYSQQVTSSKQLIDTLKSQYPQLRNQEQNLISWKCVMDRDVGTKISKKATIEVKRLESATLVKHGDTVLAFCDQYSFTISSTRGQNWKLLSFTRSHKDTSKNPKLPIEFSLQPLTAFSTDLDYGLLLELPSLEFSNIKYLSNDTLRANFFYTYNTPGQQAGIHCSGEMTFATNMSWCLIACSYTSNNNSSKFSTKFDRKLSVVNGILQVDSIREVTDVDMPKIHQHHVWSYTYDRQAKLNQNEFELSFYGLSEPPSENTEAYEDRGFNWPLWGGLGVACIVLSLLLAWMVRRRNRHKAQG